MLLKKAMRAVWANKRSYLACVFLITIGILMYTAMSIAVAGLESSMLKFYEEYRLADVFAGVDAMPMSYVDSLLEIEGIETAQGRYVTEARVEIDGNDEIKTLRLIGTDTGDEAGLNKLLITGSPLSAVNDIIVNPAFLSANGMSLGDSFSVFYGGREFTFTICATAINPEYVYITKGASEILPDDSGFGIGYISSDGMAMLAGTAGMANNVVLRLRDGYSFDDVKTVLEDALNPFGLKELFGKKDLLSYSFLELEVESLHSVSTSLPMLFVFMAVVVLYLMMKRVIEQERTQIGTMKAFGYSKAQIMLHYLFYGGVTGFAGGILGFLCGWLMSGYYFNMFLQFFTLPGLSGGLNPMLIVNAMFMSVGGGLLGAFMGAYKSLKLDPAEAMRPESPKPVKHDIVGKLKALKYILTSRGRMAMRSIMRSPLRSGFVIMGVMFSFGLLSIAGSFNSLIDKMIYGQFENIQLYGVKLTLKSPLDYGAAVEGAYGIDGVTRAEGLLEIPAELVNKNLREGIMITGIDSESALYKICDTNTKISYPPRTDGVIITNGIADKLGVTAGDTLLISAALKDDDIPVRVSRVIEQNLGTGCYMELEALGELFGQGKTATSVILNTDDLQYLKDFLKNSENTYAIDDKDSTLLKYKEMMGMYTGIYLVLEIMAALVAFAIIYNSSTISLSERKREYATLRVLGLSVNEVTEIMGFEYWTLGFIGMVLGLPFTLALNSTMNLMMDTSLYSMPSTLPATAYFVGLAGCAAAIVLSNFSSKMKIKKFDMVEVLKERE